ncbi:hypothetical protein SPYAA216_0821 [Streptococcus pyogenes AA216]|nr:hypothetical protein SPYAA216_0821 [Streptococcus pyogenes AA216]
MLSLDLVPFSQKYRKDVERGALMQMSDKQLNPSEKLG